MIILDSVYPSLVVLRSSVCQMTITVLPLIAAVYVFFNSMVAVGYSRKESLPLLPLSMTILGIAYLYRVRLLPPGSHIVILMPRTRALLTRIVIMDRHGYWSLRLPILLPVRVMITLAKAYVYQETIS